MEYVFINTPKTAGTFVNRRVVEKNKNVHTIQGHSRCVSDEFINDAYPNNQYYQSRKWWGVDLPKQPVFDDAIKFTTIRNPYDLLASYFISRWGDNDVGMRVKLPKGNFKTIVKHFCDTDNNWHVPLFRDFLYFNLFDEEGNSRCDYAIIYDTLVGGLTDFTNEHNLEFKKGGKENVTGGKGGGYKRYYDEESIALIQEKCKLELEMFNFDFNGYKGDEKIIKVSDLKIDWDKILRK